MSRRDDLFLADLVEIVREVGTFLDGVDRERWDRDDVLRTAVLHKMMLIGEIARALPDELRARYPDVPWRQIRGFRNIAVHQYFAVDWAVVWRLAQAEVPKLEEQGLVILRAEFPDLAKRFDEPSSPNTDTGPSQGASRQEIEAAVREARRERERQTEGPGAE